MIKLTFETKLGCFFHYLCQKNFKFPSSSSVLSSILIVEKKSRCQMLICKFFIYIKHEWCQYSPGNSDVSRILNTFTWRLKKWLGFGLCKCHWCVHQRASDSWRRSWGKCSASQALLSYRSWRPSPATSHHPPKMPGWGGMFPSVDRPGWPAAWLGVVNFCPTAAPPHTPPLAVWDDLGDAKQEALNK